MSFETLPNTGKFEGTVQINTKSVPVVHRPDERDRRLTRGTTLYGAGLRRRERLPDSDPTRVSGVVLIGPLAGGKTTAVESAEERWLSGDSEAEIWIVELCTDREMREDEASGSRKHRHRHLPTEEIIAWLKRDVQLPPDKREILFAERISYHWYILTREEWEKAITPTEYRKIVTFPVTPNMASVLAMLYPELVHRLASYPAYCFNNRWPPLRPGTPPAIRWWREDFNRNTAELVRRDLKEGHYNGIGLFDTLCVPLMFGEEAFPGVPLDEYRQWLGWDVSTWLLAIGDQMMGYSGWNQLVPEVAIRLQTLPQLRAELADFLAASEEEIQRIATSGHLPPEFDLTLPTQQAMAGIPGQVDYMNHLYWPGNRTLPILPPYLT